MRRSGRARRIAPSHATPRCACRRQTDRRAGANDTELRRSGRAGRSRARRRRAARRGRPNRLRRRSAADAKRCMHSALLGSIGAALGATERHLRRPNVRHGRQWASIRAPNRTYDRSVRSTSVRRTTLSASASTSSWASASSREAPRSAVCVVHVCARACARAPYLMSCSMSRPQARAHEAVLSCTCCMLRAP